MLDNVGATEHHAGLVHQIGQDALFLCRKGQPPAVHRETSLQRVIGKRPHLQHRIGMAIGTAHQRAQSHHHLFVHEGLGEIVISPCAETGQLVAPATAPGEDKHREIASLLAPLLQHRNTVQLRQPQVQHRGVIALGATQEGSLLTIHCKLGHHAGLFQRNLQTLGQLAIILDNQHSHHRTSISSSLRTLPVTGSSVSSMSESLGSRRSISYTGCSSRSYFSSTSSTVPE